MYIEVFLLDNFIFNMLIMKISAALSSLKYSRAAAVIICILQAVFSAFAINITILRSIYVKAILCFVFAVPFFISSRKITPQPIIFVLIATLLTGGLVYAFAAEGNNSWLRLILYPSLVLFLLPSVIRHLGRKKLKAENAAQLTILCNDRKYEFQAIYDSGNTLCEPLSGLPVIVLYAPQLMQYANIPILCSDTQSQNRFIYAFMPEELRVGNTAREMLIAPTDKNPNMKALIPVTVADRYINS